MNSIIFNPLSDFASRFRQEHLDKTNEFLEELVAKSGVDIEANRKTVQEHNDGAEALAKLNKKLNWLRFWRVVCCITIILIPLVILKLTPKIRAMREEIALTNERQEELMALAKRQMKPLNSLFGDRDSLDIIKKTMPQFTFNDRFSSMHEADMVENFDFCPELDSSRTALDVLAGNYNENPFVFEKHLIHQMGLETYHGYKVITWSETYRGSDGETHTRMRSQTLHATVTKPKPFYNTEVILNYCEDDGSNLSFTRDATHLDKKNDRQIERYVKRGERKLKKMTDEAIRKNSDFASMANTDFEVLFDALDRSDEVQFRTLFTPLAQTNMIDLIRSKEGFGDDFNFSKQRRSNRILTLHSQNRELTVPAVNYVSHSFDTIKENFVSKNADFFKEFYFDFAPLFAIPIYQDRPMRSVDNAKAKNGRLYSKKEYEVLANIADSIYTHHPDSKTKAILKGDHISTNDGADTVLITATS